MPMFWKKKKESEAPSHQSNPRRTDKQVNWVFVIVVLTTVLMLTNCVIMCNNTYRMPLSHKECDHRWMELRDSIYVDMDHIDSIFVTPIPSGNVNEDSLSLHSKGTPAYKFIFTQNDIESLKQTQKTLIARQDKMADDLRQETNNMINKVNGWLSFWMGVMAVLGVFVPIALQFKLYREARDSDQILRKQHEDDRIKIEEFMRQCQADIKGEYVKLEVELQRELDYYRRKVDKINLQILSARFFVNVRNLQNLADCKSISVNETRNTLLKRNLEEVVEYARAFISDYLNWSKSQEEHDTYNLYNLSVLLVAVADVLATLCRLYPHRSRRLLLLMQESYRIIKEINVVSLNKRQINELLESYYEKLDVISVFP